MNRRSKLLVFFLIFFTLVSVTALFAQRKTSVTIIASDSPAQVYINGKMIGLATPRYQFQIEPGTYELRVMKPGGGEFKRQITVGSRAMNLNINLGAAAPPVPVPQNYRLAVRSNVSGAEVFINGSLSGTIPFSGEFPKGRYNLQVRAPGYREFNGTVTMDGPEDLYISLDSLRARINVEIPSSLLNGDTGNPMARIDLFINGSKINGFSAEVEEGTHLIRITSGGLAVESYVSVQSGESYTIRPRFDFQID